MSHSSESSWFITPAGLSTLSTRKTRLIGMNESEKSRSGCEMHQRILKEIHAGDWSFGYLKAWRERNAQTSAKTKRGIDWIFNVLSLYVGRYGVLIRSRDPVIGAIDPPARPQFLMTNCHRALLSGQLQIKYQITVWGSPSASLSGPQSAYFVVFNVIKKIV